MFTLHTLASLRFLNELGFNTVYLGFSKFTPGAEGRKTVEGTDCSRLSHVRLLRFEQDGTQPVYSWVCDNIASFKKKRATAVQTEMDDTAQQL